MKIGLLSFLLMGFSLAAHALPSPNSTSGPFGAASQLLNPSPQKVGSVAAPSTTSKAATSTTASVASGFGCGDLRRIALRLSTHASNLANRNTTRTPAGGPYKRLEVVCKAAGGAFCNIEASGESQTVHAPGHLDADASGNVQYPVINVGSESAGLNMAAAELKMLAKDGVCGAKLIEQDALMIVKYNSDFDVMMDTISLASDGRMTRWSRTTRDGRTQNLSFANDGTPVGL